MFFFCLDTKIKKTICNFRSIIFASPRVHTCIVSAKAQTGLKESQLSQLNFVTVFQKAPSLRPKNVVTDAKGGKSLDDSHSSCANMCARPQRPCCILHCARCLYLWDFEVYSDLVVICLIKITHIINPQLRSSLFTGLIFLSTARSSWSVIHGRWTQFWLQIRALSVQTYHLQEQHYSIKVRSRARCGINSSHYCYPKKGNTDKQSCLACEWHF